MQANETNEKGLQSPVRHANVASMDDLKAWIKAERGRLAKLAAACGITHSAVWQWERVPQDRILVVEKVTSIPRATLRPDLYSELEAAQ